MEKLQKIVDEKKKKSANTKPRYDMRKLKVGFVSVFLGLSILLSSVVSFAQESNLGLEIGKELLATAQMAGETTTEPNYAEDEKNVGTYKETQLERGNGPAFYISDKASMDYKDGFRYNTLEPGTDSPDKKK